MWPADSSSNRPERHLVCFTDVLLFLFGSLVPSKVDEMKEIGRLVHFLTILFGKNFFFFTRAVTVEAIPSDILMFGMPCTYYSKIN